MLQDEKISSLEMDLHDLLNTKETLEAQINEAVNAFGVNVINDVRLIMELTDDFDAAYSSFEDMNMWDHVECLEMLYC